MTNTQERDAVFERLGLVVEMQPAGARLEWRGMTTVAGSSYFTPIAFPDFPEKIEARCVDRDHGEIRLGGVIYSIAAPLIERSQFLIPE